MIRYGQHDPPDEARSGNRDEIRGCQSARITGSALTAKVSVFIDAEQDSRAYAALLTDLYDEGYDVEDKGVKESGRRLVKGEQEL